MYEYTDQPTHTYCMSMQHTNSHAANNNAGSVLCLHPPIPLYNGSYIFNIFPITNSCVLHLCIPVKKQKHVTFLLPDGFYYAL